MKATISPADFDGIKAQLRVLAPEARSANRTEAMARGFGFNSSSALKAEFGSAPRGIDIDDDTFEQFLAERGTPIRRYHCLSAAVYMTQHQDEVAAIKAVMEKMPELSSNGLWHWRQSNADFDRDREEMIAPNSVQEFGRAVAFLSRYGKRVTFNQKASSYGWKHTAEKFHKRIKSDHYYIANGMFIVAAVHLGFKTKQVADGPNVYLNISTEPNTPSTPALPGSPRMTAWRNLMVAAINAGLDQGVFGLEPSNNHWIEEMGGNPLDAQGMPTLGVYRFDFKGAPAVACVNDTGNGELAIRAVIGPNPRDESLPAWHARFQKGVAVASGYLERQRGKWLVTPRNLMASFRQGVLPIVANTYVEPKGFLDHGR